jgi:hypothetical protein
LYFTPGEDGYYYVYAKQGNVNNGKDTKKQRPTQERERRGGKIGGWEDYKSFPLAGSHLPSPGERR